MWNLTVANQLCKGARLRCTLKASMVWGAVMLRRHDCPSRMSSVVAGLSSSYSSEVGMQRGRCCGGGNGTPTKGLWCCGWLP